MCKKPSKRTTEAEAPLCWVGNRAAARAPARSSDSVTAHAARETHVGPVPGHPHRPSPAALHGPGRAQSNHDTVAHGEGLPPHPAA